MNADGASLTRFTEILTNAKASKATTHVMFAADKYLKDLGLINKIVSGPLGLASSQKVCGKIDYKTKAIVERSNSDFVQVLIHELGHNLGMMHLRSWKKKLGDQYTCDAGPNNAKIMNRYAFENWNLKSYKWSACNRCDLWKRYSDVMDKNGEYCLEN